MELRETDKQTRRARPVRLDLHLAAKHLCRQGGRGPASYYPSSPSVLARFISPPPMNLCSYYHRSLSVDQTKALLSNFRFSRHCESYRKRSTKERYTAETCAKRVYGGRADETAQRTEKRYGVREEHRRRRRKKRQKIRGRKTRWNLIVAPVVPRP